MFLKILHSIGNTKRSRSTTSRIYRNQGLQLINMSTCMYMLCSVLTCAYCIMVCLQDAQIAMSRVAEHINQIKKEQEFAQRVKVCHEPALEFTFPCGHNVKIDEIMLLNVLATIEWCIVYMQVIQKQLQGLKDDMVIHLRKHTMLYTELYNLALSSSIDTCACLYSSLSYRVVT